MLNLERLFFKQEAPRLTVIQFPVRPKKTLLTVRKLDDWLKKAAERTYIRSEYEQKRFVYRFKHYPWRYMSTVYLQSRWLSYVRTPFKYWLRHGWITSWRYKVKIRGRWLYQLRFRTAMKKALRYSAFKQQQHFRALYPQGYLAQQASSFFNHRSVQSRTAWQTETPLVLKYDQIVADILKFRTWNLRRFLIKPIWVRKLLFFYLNVKKKEVAGLLTKQLAVKLNKTGAFARFLQYSLMAVLYNAFKLLGLATVLMLITKRVIWVNGVLATNPFQPCYVQDIVQLDVFSLFRVTYPQEHYRRLKSISTKARNRDKLATIAHLLSLFKNAAAIRPAAVSRHQYRFKKSTFLMYSWVMVAPKLGAWLMAQVLDKFGFFFEKTGQFWKWHKTSYSEEDDRVTERLEDIKTSSFEQPEEIAYASVLHRFHCLRTFTIFTAFERVLFKKRALPIVAGGQFLNSQSFAKNFSISRSLRLKPVFRTGYAKTSNPKLKLLFKNIFSPASIELTAALKRSSIDYHIRQQNLLISGELEASKRRGTRTSNFGQVEAYLTTDTSIFATVLHSRQPVKKGRKFFLNQDNLRFLLSFK